MKKVLLLPFLGLLAGCGGNDSANPFNSNTLNETSRGREATASTPGFSAPVPVFLSVNPAATSSTAFIGLRKVALARSAESDTVFESQTLSLWPAGLVEMKDGKPGASKFIYLGTASRNQGYVRVSLDLAGDYSYVPLGETARKTAKVANKSLSINLDPNKGFQDALVLNLSFAEDKGEAKIELGKADGALEVENQHPTMLEGRVLIQKSTETAITLSIKTKAQTWSLEGSKDMVATDTALKLQTAVFVGCLYDPTTKKLVPGLVQNSLKGNELGYSSGVLGSSFASLGAANRSETPVWIATKATPKGAIESGKRAQTVPAVAVKTESPAPTPAPAPVKP